MADDHFELVKPFKCVQSAGGPFDDHAFVAGCSYAILDQRLATRQHDVWEQYVYPELIPDLDVSAMQHGYRLEHAPWDEHPDEWTHVTFTRIDGLGDEPDG